MTIIEACQAFIKSLNQPAAYHSVWVRTQVDDNSKEFMRDICIAVRPEKKQLFKIPKDFNGYTVTQIEWPKDQLNG